MSVAAPFVWRCLSESAITPFHTHRVTGGGRPPPVPTERGVRISRTNALRKFLARYRSLWEAAQRFVTRQAYAAVIARLDVLAEKRRADKPAQDRDR
jgi:hypothetical protein